MSSWKVILATLVIFAAGVITGGVLVHYTKGTKPRGPVFMRTQMLRELTHALSLDAQQRAKVDAILNENAERTKILREVLDPEMRAEYKKTVEEIRAQLTPEQRSKFDELLKQRRKGGGGPDKKRGVPGSNGVPVSTNLAS